LKNIASDYESILRIYRTIKCIKADPHMQISLMCVGRLLKLLGFFVSAFGASGVSWISDTGPTVRVLE